MQCNETTRRIMRPVAYIKVILQANSESQGRAVWQTLKPRSISIRNIRIRKPWRGLEEYSHLWLIWEFSQAIRKRMVPTVRPPKLGGNTRVGVFATRSPFRPNPIGLSSVQLTGVTLNPQDDRVIHIQGADLLDGTPIYDIKPYIPYADSHPEARGSFATAHRDDHLQVQFPPELLNKVPQSKQKPLIQILALDPRPAYQQDSERIYGFLRRPGNQIPRRRRNPVCMRGQQRGEKIMEEIIRKYFACWLNKDENH